MKVRIADQRIVFRLNDTEREQLLKDGEISVRLTFLSTILKFTLLLNDKVDSLMLNYEQDNLLVNIPNAYMDKWNEVKIGFDETHTFPDGKAINIVIEKDLKRSKTRRREREE